MKDESCEKFTIDDSGRVPESLDEAIFLVDLVEVSWPIKLDGLELRHQFNRLHSHSDFEERDYRQSKHKVANDQQKE